MKTLKVYFKEFLKITFTEQNLYLFRELGQGGWRWQGGRLSIKVLGETLPIDLLGCCHTSCSQSLFTHTRTTTAVLAGGGGWWLKSLINVSSSITAVCKPGQNRSNSSGVPVDSFQPLSVCLTEDSRAESGSHGHSHHGQALGGGNRRAFPFTVTHQAPALPKVSSPLPPAPKEFRVSILPRGHSGFN